MPLYQYKAIDASGKFISGSLDAGNVNDLELRLEKMDMDLVTYKQKEHGSDLFGRNKITRRDLINFSFYLEQLTRAGVPILEGLADLRDGEDNPTFRDVITGLIEAIEGGNSFSQALALYPKIFDDVFVSLIRVGESSGQMEKSLNNVSYFFERDINDSIDRMEPILQTTLIATVGSIVLWLAMSIFGPIYDTISTIQF